MPSRRTAAEIAGRCPVLRSCSRSGSTASSFRGTTFAFEPESGVKHPVQFALQVTDVADLVRPGWGLSAKQGSVPPRFRSVFADASERISREAGVEARSPVPG